MGGEGRSVAAGVIFGGSYLALAIVRIPGLSIDRSRQLCALSRTPVWKPTSSFLPSDGVSLLFGRFWQAWHPPRYAAFNRLPSPRLA
jgi:hypothetical protein